ncbi:hypothetical protein HDV02_001073, partial [Globomyces sp. JEL0801]
MNQVCAGVRVAQIASISFDVSVGDIFETLSCHGTLVLRDSQDFYDCLSKVSNIHITPTALRKINIEDYPNIKSIIVGGERLFGNDIDKILKTASLYHSYGPTETTVCSSFKHITSPNCINIGKPMANTVQYIVDKHLQLVPIGVPGELLIGGVGVALG